jgi:glycosyl transferase family 1
MWRKPAWFLLSPTWTIENYATARTIRRAAVRHRILYPMHRFVFLCNTEGEAEQMRSFGEAATTHNKTTNTNENVFRPLDGLEVDFDAIYNAQLAKWKRHELSVDIPTCAFLYYRGISSTSESEAALIARHMMSAPAHVFVNEFDETGKPIRLPPDVVNHYLNRAAVGLCLSEEEGAMFASAEYQLAGLPVVTTPNKGGRDFYVDGDFCLTARDDPRDIADAVAALKQRRIPREAVRERVLGKIISERRKFIDLVNAIYREAGVAEEFAGFWPLSRPVIMQWQTRRAARKMVIRGSVDDIARHKPGRIVVGSD